MSVALFQCSNVRRKKYFPKTMKRYLSIIFNIIYVSCEDLCVCDLMADQSPKNLCMPLRSADALVGSLWTSSSSLSVSHYTLLFIMCSVTLCLPIFFPYVSLTSFAVSILSQTARVAILCHFCFIFSPCVPFSLLQSNPFTLSSDSLGHPRVPSAFFHRLLFPLPSLPLCSAHLQHIKIPLFFLQRIVQSLRDLLHSSMLSLPLSLHICLSVFFSVLAALHNVWFRSSLLSF